MEQKNLFRVGCAAIIKRDNKVLLAQRGETKAYAGLWEAPGGKLEYGEQPEDCVRREVEEETELKVEKARLAGVASAGTGEFGPWVALFYECECSGEPQDLEPEARGPWKWFALSSLPSDLTPWLEAYFKAKKPRIVKLSKNRLRD
jgi:8-oxo-dGTP diphosphatase